MPRVDDAAGDRAAAPACVYCGDGPDELAGAVEQSWPLDPLGALERAPAEVLGRLVGLEQHAVDLLDVVLADVADPDLAERGVEREAPRVAQAGQHDVASRGRGASTSAASSLPSRSRGSCARAARVERAAAVAEAEVEPPVGAERELAAVVVLLGLVDVQQLAQRLGSIVPSRGRGTRRRACRPSGRDQCRYRRRLVAKSGWKAMPSRPCSAPSVTRSERSSSVVRRPPVEPDHAAGLLEHPQRVGSPGATPTHVGRLKPLAIALDVEVVRAAALGARPSGELQVGERRRRAPNAA